MKKLFTFLCIAAFALPSMANTVLQNTAAAAMLHEKIEQAGLPQQLSQMTAEDFLNLTPGKVKEMTGQKLKFKQVVTLKAAQKAIRKEMGQDGDDPAGAAKSQLVALLLCIFIGELGIHRFYLGYTTIGIIQLLTLGGCGIWALIDLIRIITGDLKPADGSEYNPTL